MLQFLAEGDRPGEHCLYVTLSETKAELEFALRSHDWSPDGIAVAPALPLQST
jgi:circadian clock protein KaiC